jgi:uncharacterized protein with von Willebrand factor type A (vWA) domain
MADRFVPLLVDFGRALRTEGITVGSGDVLTFCMAMVPLDPTDMVDLYWGGRTSLITRREDIPVYDRVFRQFFLGEDAPAADLLRALRPEPSAAVSVQIPLVDPGDQRGEEAKLGLVAANVEILRHKSFAACTPEELDTLRKIMAKLRLTPPRRRTRRTRPARSGRTPDLRRTIRKSLRTNGEPAELCWRRRRLRPRPLILILDISGSMADFSRGLLQFAHSAGLAARKVEVFCFSTRLTRITKPLRTRGQDDALTRAAERVVDWEGGTRIGDCLDRFVRDWARPGLCRGGIVVICSDGLDRGDPDVLAKAMQRLSLLCHRVVWMNPHKGADPGFRPSTLGMMVAAPHVDLLLSGHDLRSFEEFASVLPTL